MFQKISQEISAGDKSTNIVAARDINIYIAENIPVELIDKTILQEVDLLRKSRFFPEFDIEKSSLSLGLKLSDGNLSGGSNSERGLALAWCARLLSLTNHIEKAESFLELSKTLGELPETDIAEALIVSQRSGKVEALKLLANINSEVSRSVGLAVVAHHDGADAALNWLDAAGYNTSLLDSYGKYFALNWQLELSRWDEAASTVDSLSENDFDETPVLYHLAAVTKLLTAVPPDFRRAIVRQAPFEANNFRLASDAISMTARRAAHGLFLSAIEVARQFQCHYAAQCNDEYALWLELCDPEQSIHGKTRLEEKLREPGTALGFVHYALQFGVDLDLDAVERSIEECIVINGGLTYEAAIARYALAFNQPTAEDAANYLDHHHNLLSTYIDANLMRYRQIELFSQAGLTDRANEVLDELLVQDVPTEEEDNLRRIISEAKGYDSVESRKAQYKQTGAIADLINLVDELEKNEEWGALRDYGRRLFGNTGALRDAERLVISLDKTKRSGEVVFFLKENSDLLPQSNLLRMTYAWSLYYEGAMLESRAALTECDDELDHKNYRILQVNLGIATGDWDSLSAYIVDECRNSNDRSAHDLLAAAQLALHLKLPQVKKLVFDAASKANDDPEILSTAYFIATNAGWESDPPVNQWLEKAARLSGKDGPLQSMSLKDILDRKPEWDRRESETKRLLTMGQIPIFLASQSMNQTLIGLTTFPALINLNEFDPRRRTAIPAYSGKHVPTSFDIAGKTVAMDATALLTLSFLKILDVALDACKSVFISHSTLAWLFDERRKAAFHQPSRIDGARKIRDFIAKDLVKKFAPSTVANSDLTAQVGEELASLIAEAEMVREADNVQHVMVRPSPVYRASSLMQEEADLSGYSSFLSSCLAVVEKLRQKGQLTAQDEKRARAYLQLHEKPWPSQPDIADGAILYLDDLAVSSLLHLGLLEKLKAAGLVAIVSPRKLSEIDALISYGSIAEEVKNVIEDIRISLNSRIESGNIKVAGRHRLDEPEAGSISQHPSVGIFALAPKCDLVVIDDRFFNKHANIEVDSGRAQATVTSTLGLLDSLVATSVLTDDNRLEYRTRLRQAGYFFVPVDLVELERSMNESTVANGQVIETAELKAIRESLLRVRMSECLQLPEEASWLDITLKVYIESLRNLWVDGANIDEVAVRSDWFFRQLDIRGWMHCFHPENSDNTIIIRDGRAMQILSLLILPTGVEQNIVDAYWKWVEQRVLIPLKEQSNELYEWLVDQHRSYIENITERLLSETEIS